MSASEMAVHYLEQHLFTSLSKQTCIIFLKGLKRQVRNMNKINNVRNAIFYLKKKNKK